MDSKIKLGCYSMLVGKKQDDDWYDWCVFVDEDAVTLANIRSVEYTLHPTFPNPIRRVEEVTSRFALFSSGWGGFRIGVDVEWKDGSHTKTAYVLRLAVDEWPKKAAPAHFDTVEKEEVYKALFSEKFRWRKAETLAKTTNIPEGTVLKILDELQREELVRKADFLSFERKELWAPTAIVGLSPRI